MLLVHRMSRDGIDYEHWDNFMAVFSESADYHLERPFTSGRRRYDLCRTPLRNRKKILHIYIPSSHITPHLTGFLENSTVLHGITKHLSNQT
jgi:hypothetical protein